MLTVDLAKFYLQDIYGVLYRNSSLYGVQNLAKAYDRACDLQTQLAPSLSRPYILSHLQRCMLGSIEANHVTRNCTVSNPGIIF